jgi:hypothetical protein
MLTAKGGRAGSRLGIRTTVFRGTTGRPVGTKGPLTR